MVNMNTQEAFKSFVTYLTAVGRSPRTIETYKQKCRHFLDKFGDYWVADITPEDIDIYLLNVRRRGMRWVDHPIMPEQEGGLSDSTIHSIMRHIRSFLNWCAKRGHCDISPADHIIIKRRRSRRILAHCTNDTAKAIEMLSEQNTLGSRRDLLLFRFILDTGCRAGEACSVLRADIDRERCQVLANGKTDEDYLFFSPDILPLIDDWLAVAPPSPWLFCGLHTAKGEQITTRNLWQIFKRRKIKFGLTGRLNPHSHRHGVAQEWANKHGVLRTQAKLRHVDVNSTLFYVRPNDEDIRRLTASTRIV